MIYAPHKSTIGNLDANLVALLVYFVSTVAGWIPIVKYAAWLAPLVVFFVEKTAALSGSIPCRPLCLRYSARF